MTKLPSSVTPYKKTTIFTSDNIPKAFLKEHSTAPGTWGILHIIEGTLIFCDDETGQEYPLAKDKKMVIAPTKRHHLKLSGYAEIYVEFYH
ncbi:DUF1971 domain-containing protein [Endozoicomonas sp. Mp262]|uniref:DUF1971 domain-containing protein n=1 Tax=Endozoicomonas sp. Mp262 TaxID=2919499 RepID=UPI0021E0F5D4